MAYGFGNALMPQRGQIKSIRGSDNFKLSFPQSGMKPLPNFILPSSLISRQPQNPYSIQMMGPGMGARQPVVFGSGSMQTQMTQQSPQTMQQGGIRQTQYRTQAPPQTTYQWPPR